MHKLLPTVLVPCLLLSAATAQRLLAIDSDRTLYSLNAVTAAKTPLTVVSPAVGTPSALAYDAVTGLLYLTSITTDSLYTVDLATGNATLVGPFGDPALVMHGLEFDSSSGQLYGCSAHDGGLYAIDATTGTATLRGLSGLVGSLNLGYDDRTATMFATSTGGDSLYRVDPTNGAMLLIGNLQGSPNPQGLAFHSGIGTLYLIDNATDQLHAVDCATGVGHAVGSTGPGNLLGLVYLPGGAGSIQRQPHQCGPASILATGVTRPGGTITVHVGGSTGLPFVGFGMLPAAVPFCGCTIGHEWALAFAGSMSNVAIPPGPGLLGVQVGMQGLDLFGGGGCGDPLFGLTDTLLLTIG